MTARLFTGGRLLRPDPAPAAIDSLAVAGGTDEQDHRCAEAAIRRCG